MTDPATPPVIHLSNRGYGMAVATVLLALSALLVAMLLWMATSRGVIPDNAGVARTAMILLVVAVVFWLAILIAFLALTKTLLSLDLGADVSYRCLLGRRHVPWSDIAQMVVQESVDGESAFFGAIFRTDGELTLVRTNGSELSIKIPSSQRQHVDKIVKAFKNLQLPERIRLSRWTAMGFFVAGLTVLSTGIYADYLLYMGTWTKDVVAEMNDVRGKFLMTILPFLFPVVGVAICGCSLWQLLRKRSAI